MTDRPRAALLAQGQLPRPSDIMSLRIDNGERATLEYADIALSPTRYIASWLRQRGWRLPEYRWRPHARPAWSLLCLFAACFGPLHFSLFLVQYPILLPSGWHYISLCMAHASCLHPSILPVG